MVHQYKLNGYNIVLDTVSGSGHAVDEVAYDIIQMYKSAGEEEIVSKILEKYPDREDVTESDIRDCFADLEELRNDTNTEILRVATLLYDSKALATEPKSYKKWVEDFFNILGRKSPANPSRTKSMPTKQIINQYYYIDIPNN